MGAGGFGGGGSGSGSGSSSSGSNADPIEPIQWDMPDFSDWANGAEKLGEAIARQDYSEEGLSELYAAFGNGVQQVSDSFGTEAFTTNLSSFLNQMTANFQQSVQLLTASINQSTVAPPAQNSNQSITTRFTQRNSIGNQQASFLHSLSPRTGGLGFTNSRAALVGGSTKLQPLRIPQRLSTPAIQRSFVPNSNYSETLRRPSKLPSSTHRSNHRYNR